MVRWLRWHCPPDTGFEIRALAVWGRARYLSVTEAPHNTNFHTWMGRKQFCFFQTAETGNRTPDSGVKGSGANHYPRAPARASLEPLRSVSWAAATQSMPGPLAESLGSLCDNEKMIMLLSGLNCPYITEWQVIYEDIITFLATMYTKFKANLDRLWFPTSCSQYLEMSQ